MNHHQLPICMALYEMLGDDFCFVANCPTPAERLNFGYEDMNKKYPFVLTTYDSEENMKRAYNLADDSDVVIIGSSSDSFIKKRLKNGKITFKYGERLFKDGTQGIKYKIKNYLRVFKHYKRFSKHPIYSLCASAYAAGDINTYLNFEDRVYKWGYFTKVIKYDIDELIKKKEPHSILWTGRFLGLKHPESAVWVAKKLKEEGYDFCLTFVGTGEKESEVKELIAENNLCDNIKLVGALPYDKVRKYMEKSEIFLFTSDFNEGWGAVLNEAMNSGCACVASHAIGSAPFLIEEKKNGLIFESENWDSLYKKVKYLLDNEKERNEMSKAAYQTMLEVWNPDVAAKRLVELIDCLMQKKTYTIQNGPCSRAENIYNNWYTHK